MHSIEFKHNIYKGFGYINIDLLKNHEEVVEDRASSLLNYLRSIENYVVIPSILICNQTNTIIDGHHRCWALKELGVKEAPVTFINYSHADIVTHLTEGIITKKEIIDAALSGNLLKPKSSYHHVIDIYGEPKPLLLLSSLSKCEIGR